MATIAVDDLAELRRACSQAGMRVNYSKPQINTALQAIEDWFDRNRPALDAAIDAATVPFVFTVAQKGDLIFACLEQKGRKKR
jgi:hypothetical protein